MSNDIPAGWLDDPEVEGKVRYWDGSQWTDHVQNKYADVKKVRSYSPDGGFDNIPDAGFTDDELRNAYRSARANEKLTLIRFITRSLSFKENSFASVITTFTVGFVAVGLVVMAAIDAVTALAS